MGVTGAEVGIKHWHPSRSGERRLPQESEGSGYFGKANVLIVSRGVFGGRFKKKKKKALCLLGLGSRLLSEPSWSRSLPSSPLECPWVVEFSLRPSSSSSPPTLLLFICQSVFELPRPSAGCKVRPVILQPSSEKENTREVWARIQLQQ